MYGSELFNFPLWWIFPLVMMVLCAFGCFSMMKWRRGAMMCGFGPRPIDDRHGGLSDSPEDILDKRYALGEIDRKEYEEKKKTVTQPIKKLS